MPLLDAVRDMVSTLTLRWCCWRRGDDTELRSKIRWGIRIYYLRVDKDPRRMAERKRCREAAARVNARLKSAQT